MMASFELSLKKGGEFLFFSYFNHRELSERHYITERLIREAPHSQVSVRRFADLLFFERDDTCIKVKKRWDLLYDKSSIKP